MIATLTKWLKERSPVLLLLLLRKGVIAVVVFVVVVREGLPAAWWQLSSLQ
jgi:hypothetical protein